MERLALVKNAIIGLVVCSLVGFSTSGAALAQASISNTGPDSVNKIEIENSVDCEVTNDNNVSFYNDVSQYATSGDANVGGDQTNGWMFKWDNWNPKMWQNSGKEFGEWWDGFMQWEGNNAKDSTWNTGTKNSEILGNDWKPAGHDWQDNWINWNPLTWVVNGQSYGNWHQQLMNHLNTKYDDWQNEWRGSSGNTNAGEAITGDAINTSTVNISTNISNSHSARVCLPEVHTTPPTPTPNNPGQGGGQIQQPATSGYGGSGGGYGGGYGGSGGGYGGGTPTPATIPAPNGVGGPVITPTVPECSSNNSISETGPDSYNKIEISSSLDVNISNNNHISSVNNVNQYASSGDANVSDNTNGGGGQTGDAANYSANAVAVNITN